MRTQPWLGSPAAGSADPGAVPAGDDRRELMPCVRAGVEVNGPVGDGTELGVGSPRWEGHADARRPGRPGLADRRYEIRVAGDDQDMLARAGSGQLHQADRDPNVCLLLFPSIAHPAAVRAAHLSTFELAEDRLDVRRLERIEVAKVSRDGTGSRRLHVASEGAEVDDAGELGAARHSMEQRRAKRREVQPAQRTAETSLCLAQRVVDGPRNEETPGVATPGGPRVLLAGVTRRVCDGSAAGSTAFAPARG